MSEIVLNYTGLDNVPGKIVFNKSSDYYEWLNRGKPMNVETLDVEIDEVKANGTYIKVPEKEGGYFDKVVMNVNVPRRSQATGFTYYLYGYTFSARAFDFRDSEKVSVSSISTNDDIHNEEVLTPYKFTVKNSSSSLNLGLVMETIENVTLNSGEFLFVMSDEDDALSMKFYTSAGISNLTLRKDTYIALFKDEVDDKNEHLLVFGFYNSDETCSPQVRIDYAGMKNASIKSCEVRCKKTDYNFRGIYQKCATLE